MRGVLPRSAAFTQEPGGGGLTLLNARAMGCGVCGCTGGGRGDGLGGAAGRREARLAKGSSGAPGDSSTAVTSSRALEGDSRAAGRGPLGTVGGVFFPDAPLPPPPPAHRPTTGQRLTTARHSVPGVRCAGLWDGKRSSVVCRRRVRTGRGCP